MRLKREAEGGVNTLLQLHTLFTVHMHVFIHRLKTHMVSSLSQTVSGFDLS